ncbi:MAG: S41 family peptidase [Pseudomonadota bacterium]|nr:S41 family peptidase [Pseudomonadota bacterium]
MKFSLYPPFAGIALVVLAGALGAEPATNPDAPAPPPELEAVLPLDELRLFVEVFDRIRTAYVEPVDDAQLLQEAIRGMLSGLDPHSTFLDAEQFEALETGTSGEFGGIGIEIGLEDGFIKIISPMDDTPAMRAGVQPGDLILKIDQQPTKGMGLAEAVDLLRGEVGSRVTLTLLREGTDQPLDVVLERAAIKVPSIKAEVLEPGFGYLRIAQFQTRTAKDLATELHKLGEAAELRGLVLDLRNNPGGLLRSAVEVTDLFLDQGLIVYTDGRLPESKLRYQASPETAVPDLPLVVLINGGSASAAEIVAGALQDHRRALLVGTRSFGKGSVQTVLPLTEDRAVKLTTALYFTPSGRSIQAQGIDPDIQVRRAEIKPLQDEPGSYRESDLSGHLENGAAGKTRTPVAAAAISDYQLQEALNLLKGIAVFNRPRTTGE